MLTLEEIRRLAENDFSQEFKEIVLKQCGTSTPLSLSGPGTLHMTSTGYLRIKIHVSSEVNVFDRLLEEFGPNESAGSLIGETSYYDMEATDYYGREWRAKRFLIDPQWFAPTSSGIVHATLDKVTTRRQITNAPSKQSETTYFRGTPEIPFNKWVLQPNGSKSRSALDVELGDGITCEIRKEQRLTVISVELPLHDSTNQLTRHTAEAVSIATGSSLTCMYRYRNDGREIEASIWSNFKSIHHEESALWSPFDLSCGQSTQTFIGMYVLNRPGNRGGHLV